MQVVQAALKGLQCCLSGGKWKFGGAEELGSVLASLKVKKKKDLHIFLLIYHHLLLISHKHYMTVDIVHVFCRGSCSRELQV